ncbi:Ig-like domain-containing protein [Fontivita pretiosa]|uniref:Ig-like domain-containing protein n=1 Tax=Fontivita pretiosa TaxID=2989684 RepID=UPI003D17CDCC
MHSQITRGVGTVRAHVAMEMLETRKQFAADLVGTAFDVTAGWPLPGGDVSATFTVRNQNGIWWLDDAGAFYVQIFLSPDDTIGDAGDLPIGTASFTGLGAGQSVSRTIALSLPQSDPFLHDNDYRIGMVIDPAAQVAESDESNNANRGNGLDSERVCFERHVYSPVNPNYPQAEGLNAGQSVWGAIGGSDERMGPLDIDTYYFSIVSASSHATPQTVAFDLDGGGWTSHLRLYSGNWSLMAQNSGGAAPGEPEGSGESLIRYTLNTNTVYYLVVSAVGNHSSDARTLAGRNPAAQGSYVINAVMLPNAPTVPDLAASSDTGRSSSDNITSASSLTFTFTGQPGKIGQLYVDGVLRGTDPNGSTSGQYQITVTGLGDGSHTVTTALLDPTNGYASDNSAPLTIRTDRLAPQAAAPDLAATTDSGLSSDDNITNWITPAFLGTTEPDSLVELFRNGALLTSGYSNPSGGWLLTPTLTQQGACNITIRVTDPAGNVSAVSPALPFTLDTVGPSLTSPLSFQFDAAPHRITMAFSDDVSATLSSADLTVLDLASWGTVGVTLAYNQSERSAAFGFAGVLAQGNYRATINASGVTDVAGNGVGGITVLDFFFMVADANHDRSVNARDLNILAGNWQGGGKVFSEGDLNYDGRVNELDLNLLATNWQSSLAAPIDGTSLERVSAVEQETMRVTALIAE